MNRTDDRIRCYSQSDELALRMTRHGARRSTVSVWTGVSVKRIATLVRQSREGPRARHQERTPLRVAYFFRTPRLMSHAATLGILFELYEVVSDAGTSSQSFPTLSLGEALCSAYEMYGDIVDSALIGFEHAVLLATALAESKEISLQQCPRCEGAMLVGCLAPAGDACTHCRSDAVLPIIAGNSVESAGQDCPATSTLMTKSDQATTAKELKIHHTTP